MIVLKNVNGKATVRTTFRGREVTIFPKHSHILKDNEEGRAEAKHLLETYGFLIDITERMKEEMGGEASED